MLRSLANHTSKALPHISARRHDYRIVFVLYAMTIARVLEKSSRTETGMCMGKDISQAIGKIKHDLESSEARACFERSDRLDRRLHNPLNDEIPCKLHLGCKTIMTVIPHEEFFSIRIIYVNI